MEQDKINFIVAETTDLHNNTAALYEALMDEEKEEVVNLINSMRSKLLTIKKDILNEV